MVEKYEQLIEIAEYRTDNPDVDPTGAHFMNPVPGREINKPANGMEETGLWWQSEFKESF